MIWVRGATKSHPVSHACRDLNHALAVKSEMLMLGYGRVTIFQETA
jgi:hypothetical protein